MKILAYWMAVSTVMVTASTVAESNTIYRLAPAEGSFLETHMTQDIYRFSGDPALSDLQVLDADNTPLPYRLVPAEPIKISPQETALRFFPIPADTPAETLRQVYTSIQFQGAQVEVSGNNLATGHNQEEAPEFYLIDIGKLEHPLMGLRLDWDANPPHQYIEVELEASCDLQQWSSQGRATLVNLGNNGLVRNKLPVTLQTQTFDFLRLRVIRGGDKLHINSIKGEGARSQIPVAEERWHLNANHPGKITDTQPQDSAHGSNDHKVTAWEFTRAEVTPATGIAILLGDSTYADGYTLYSRASERQAWQLEHRGIWYNARIGSQWESSDPLPLAGNSRRFWRLELDAGGSKLEPRLELRWQPARLRLIANDKPPFSLAINQRDNNRNREQVFDHIVATHAVHWIPTQLENLHQRPDTINSMPDIDWRDWVFWGMLALAVAILLGFSLRLLRQLNRQLANPQSDGTN